MYQRNNIYVPTKGLIESRPASTEPDIPQPLGQTTGDGDAGLERYVVSTWGKSPMYFLRLLTAARLDFGYARPSGGYFASENGGGYRGSSDGAPMLPAYVT